MSPNLVFGLFDGYISLFSSACPISVPISPQDFGHTFVGVNIAINSMLVKPREACATYNALLLLCRVPNSS